MPSGARGAGRRRRGDAEGRQEVSIASFVFKETVHSKTRFGVMGNDTHSAIRVCVIAARWRRCYQGGVVLLDTHAHTFHIAGVGGTSVLKRLQRYEVEEGVMKVSVTRFK